MFIAIHAQIYLLESLLASKILRELQEMPYRASIANDDITTCEAISKYDGHLIRSREERHLIWIDNKTDRLS